MDAKTPTLMRARAAVLVLFLAAIGAVGCVTPPSLQTRAGRAAYAGGHVLQRVEELQNAAIAANATIDPKTGQPGLSTATARVVVAYCVAAAKTLRAMPAGWQKTIATGFTEMRAGIPPDEAQQLGPYLAAIDTVLAALTHSGGTP